MFSHIQPLTIPKPSMALWRKRLFVFLSRNSQRVSSFFHIPSEQVVEIGVVEI
jgi:KUP system potassium uptake protein